MLHQIEWCCSEQVCQHNEAIFLRVAYFAGHRALDVSGIIEKFNVYATLAIMPRTKGINKAFWFHFYTIFARRIWLFYYFTIIPETSIIIRRWSAGKLMSLFKAGSTGGEMSISSPCDKLSGIWPSLCLSRLYYHNLTLQGFQAGMAY